MERNFHDVNSNNEDIRKGNYNGNDQIGINNIYMNNNNNMNNCNVANINALENMKYNQNIFNKSDINLYKYNLLLKRNNMHIQDNRKNINSIITSIKHTNPNNNKSNNNNSNLINGECYNNSSTYNTLDLNNTSYMQNPNVHLNECENIIYKNQKQLNNTIHCHNDINNMKNTCLNKNLYEHSDIQNNIQFSNYTRNINSENKYPYNSLNSDNNSLIQFQMDNYVNEIDNNEIKQLMINMNTHKNLTHIREREIMNSTCNNNLVKSHEENFLNSNQSIVNNKIKINQENQNLNNDNITNKIHFMNNSLNENIANNNYSSNSSIGHGIKDQDDKGMQNYMNIHENQYINSNGIYGNSNGHLNSNLFNNNLYFPNMQINNKVEMNGKNNKHDNKISEFNTTPNNYDSLIKVGIKHINGNKNSTELKNNSNLNKINLNDSSALCSPINGNKNNIKFSKCVKENNDYIVISTNNNNFRNITKNNNFENIKNIPNIVNTGDIINTCNIDESEYLNNTESIENIESNSLLAHKKKVNINNKFPLNIYISTDHNSNNNNSNNSNNSNNNNNITKDIENNSDSSNNSIQVIECENKKVHSNNNPQRNKIVNNANTNNNIESFDTNSFPYANYIINNSSKMKNISHNNINGKNFNNNGIYGENMNIHDKDGKLYNNLSNFYSNLNINNSQNLRKMDNNISRNGNDNNNYMHDYNSFSNNGNNLYNNINPNNNGYLKQKNKEIIMNHQNDRTHLNNDVFINLDNSTNTPLSNSASFGTISNSHLNNIQNNSNQINPDILINNEVNSSHISNVINNGNPNYMTKGLRNNNNNNVLINDVTNINSQKTGKHVNSFMSNLTNNNGFNLYNNIDMGINKNTENNSGNMNKIFPVHTNMSSDLKNTINNLNDNNKSMTIKPPLTNFAPINQTQNNYNIKKYVYASNINKNMDGYSPKLIEYSLKNDNTKGVNYNIKDRSLANENAINFMRRNGINDHFMNKSVVHNLANNGNEIENMTNSLQIINNIQINRSSDINKYKNELLNNLNDFSNRNDGDNLILNREHAEIFSDRNNNFFYKDITNNNMNANMNMNANVNANMNMNANVNANMNMNANVNANINSSGNNISINNLQNNMTLNGNYDLLKIMNISNDDNKLNSIDVKNNLSNLTNMDNFQNKIQLRQKTHACSENGGCNNMERNNSAGMSNRTNNNLGGVLNIGNINYNKFYDTTQQNSRIQKNNIRQNNPNINGISNNGNSMNNISNIYSTVNHLNSNANRSNLNVNEIANNNKIHLLNNNVTTQTIDGLILMRNKCTSNDIKYFQNEYENGINKIGYTSSNGNNQIGKYELNLKNKDTLPRSNTNELSPLFNKNEYLYHAQNNNNKYPDMYNNNIGNHNTQMVNSNNNGYVKNGINNINKNNLFKVENVNRINNNNIAYKGNYNNGIKYNKEHNIDTEINNNTKESINPTNVNNYNDLRKNSYQIINDNNGGFNESEKGTSSNYNFQHNEIIRNCIYDVEADKLVKNENINKNNRGGFDYINNNFNNAYSTISENYNRNNFAKYEFNKIMNTMSKGDLNNSLNLKNLTNINKNFNILMSNLDSQNVGNYVNHETKDNCNINIDDNNNNQFYNGNNHKMYIHDNHKKNIQSNNLNIFNDNNKSSCSNGNNVGEINMLSKKNNMISENINANNISLNNIAFKVQMQKNGYMSNDNNISGISDMGNFGNQDNLMYILNRNNNVLMKNGNNVNGNVGYINTPLNNDGILGLNNHINFNTIHNNVTNINNNNVDHLIISNISQGKNNNDQSKFNMNQHFQEIKNGYPKIGNKRKQIEPSKTIDLSNIDENQFLNNGKKNVRRKKKESVNTSSGSSGNDALLPNSKNKILGKISQNTFQNHNTTKLSISTNNSELDTNQQSHITPESNTLSNCGTSKQFTEPLTNSETNILNNSIKENIYNSDIGKSENMQIVDNNYIIHNNTIGNINYTAFERNNVSMNENLKNSNNIIYKENGSVNNQNNASNTKDMNTMMMGSGNEFYHKIKIYDNDVNIWDNKNGVMSRKNDQFQFPSYYNNMKRNETENGQKVYQKDVLFPNTKISEISVTDSTISDYKNEEHDLKENQVQKSFEYIDKHIANYENLITNLSFISDKGNKEIKKENDKIYNGVMNFIPTNINIENLTEKKNGIEYDSTSICKNINELFDNKIENEKINKSNSDINISNSSYNMLVQSNNQTESVIDNSHIKENNQNASLLNVPLYLNEVDKMDDNDNVNKENKFEANEFEDNMNKHVFFKNKKQYETYIMFNDINAGKDNINLFMSMNISPFNQSCRKQNEAYNLYLENEEGNEMNVNQTENINTSNIQNDNPVVLYNDLNSEKCDLTNDEMNGHILRNFIGKTIEFNENINISENEMIKNNMLRSLLSINSKAEIKKIIENKIFEKNNENKKIVFSVVKQIDGAKFLYILRIILKEQNISCNKNKIKVLKIQKKKILYKTFYQKSNKSKALTLEYILKPYHNVIGEMNCLVRSEECLLESDREKRNIEKIINANFEITTTTVSMATPTIINLFKNDYMLQNSYYCDIWSFYLCLNDQFNATIEFHQNMNKANGNKLYKLSIRAHCENYETFFENFIEFLV
ncbi:conserved Plasmodium protein, unknown function [Plasmodium berghei]|uniref:FHA domain-containing protein n=2 Tax=Plasmodium berghei TaxID=5821 RepID=A0A509AER7_PLABA|nr:conserved Plasmodium protein, unknown function [Plasmodium berghei ANKA]CXH82906.1 conserved Plasmodium protein, unknown function [Plasmodium berghei]SCM19242.1 conserved Plasmodium protein, unknown function [Plasmodium berghei]SCN21675.1 conserved Plasmodium protein, unknown function [Plasmodium berghei]SCO58970.1 conserved Plasmodium protein, unknown function [Plasmodium berghei]VUC53837.1 conserved Plasmodium protein, unknown function [Plasmodium berghei ANKA]|eukprot:XP_034419701.1 conserved Plasmodium protein, unknown function [Plasmodium berghei ANKA]